MSITEVKKILLENFARGNEVYEDISKFKEDFWNEFEKKSSKIVYLEGSRVVSADYSHKTCKSYFQSWLNEVKKEDMPSPYTLSNVKTRLGRPKADAKARKNADLREYKTYEQYYMVKKYFTFGHKIVKDDEIHVYVTLNKGLDIHFEDNFPVGHLQEGYLPHDEMRLRRVSIPQEDVLILFPGEKYTMVSPQKSVFYFNVFSLDDGRDTFGDEIDRLPDLLLIHKEQKWERDFCVRNALFVH